jgi:hypothetical protein
MGLISSWNKNTRKYKIIFAFYDHRVQAVSIILTYLRKK